LSKNLKQTPRFENLSIDKEENIEIGVKETECLSVRWIQFALNREKWQGFVVNVLNLQVPY